MASRVIVFSSAKEDLARLPRKVQDRIASAIDELTSFPFRKTGIKKLKSPLEGFRKRAGDQRILFDYADDIVFIHGIKNRKDAYR